MSKLLLRYRIKNTGHVIEVYVLKTNKLNLPKHLQVNCDSFGYLKQDINKPIQGTLRQVIPPGIKNITIFEITFDYSCSDGHSHPWHVLDIPIPGNVKLPWLPNDTEIVDIDSYRLGDLIKWGMIDGKDLNCPDWLNGLKGVYFDTINTQK